MFLAVMWDNIVVENTDGAAAAGPALKAPGAATAPTSDSAEASIRAPAAAATPPVPPDAASKIQSACAAAASPPPKESKAAPPLGMGPAAPSETIIPPGPTEATEGVGAVSSHRDRRAFCLETPL